MPNFLDNEGLRSYHTKLVDLVKSLVGVTSFNDRKGAVIPQEGDYNASMVGAVPDTRKVNGKQLNADIAITKDDIEGLVLVGKSMSGQTVTPTVDTSVTAGEGAEVFNDYRNRTFSGNNAASGNIASGAYSHAEGGFTTASGYRAHSEGGNTRASGGSSHAEGGSSEASGNFSHAEGGATVASGSHSHAEGDTTKALGSQAHSEGYHTTASAGYTHAEGYQTTASKSGAHVEGTGGEASGGSSHAEGNGCIASQYTAHAEGDMTKAIAHSAHAEGGETEASGSYSHVEGYKSRATGSESHAEGYWTEASGNYSHAEGNLTIANGDYSHAGGFNTATRADYQTAIGVWNTESTSSTDKFIIGKGTADATANCFRVTDTGTFAEGAYNSSGADYAEFFEWLDGNVNDEKRLGLFVTLDGERIRIANSGDRFILGIVSGNPSVVGDVFDDQWQGMYLYDIYGQPLWEDVDIPEEAVEEPDPEDPEKTVKRVIVRAHTEHRQKLNPNYDHTQIYIPRSQRKEWSCVGMLGKLIVQDDGTSQVNGYVKVGENGKATASDAETKYRVMSRIDENHIKVLILANS